MPPKQSQQGWSGARADFFSHGGPEGGALDPVSNPDAWLMEMVGGVLWISIDGGAWFAFASSSGVSGTLQQAYDGGGTVGGGSGRSITNMGGGAIVASDTAANDNDVFQVTKNPAGAQAGNGISVVMGATTTGDAVSATISGGERGLVVTDAAAAASGARATRLGFFTEASTFTANGSFSTSRVRIDNVAIASGGATTLTLNQPVLHVVSAPTVAAGGTITDTSTGISISMTPATASAVTGLSVTMASTTSITGRAIDVAWQSLAGETGGVVRIALDNNGVGVAQPTVLLGLASKTASFTLGSTLTGIDCNLSNNVVPGAQIVSGMNIVIGASSNAGTTAISISSSQTGAASFGISTTMTPGAGATVGGISCVMGGNANGPCFSAQTGGTGPCLDMVASGTAVPYIQIQSNGNQDPAAGAATTARLYSRLNGGGKMELIVRFPTGAVQVIKTEP